MAKGKSHSHVQSQADFNYVLDSMGTKHHLLGRNFDFYVLRSGQETYVNMSVSQDTTISKPQVKSEKSKGRRGRGLKTKIQHIFYTHLLINLKVRMRKVIILVNSCIDYISWHNLIKFQFDWEHLLDI